MSTTAQTAQKSNSALNPKHMELAIWWGGKGDTESYYALCDDNLTAQNILLACYNNPCTAEEISIKTGVAVPCLEQDLDKLREKNVLVLKDGRYETNIVIFTKEYYEDADEKTLPVVKDTAEIIGKFLDERLGEIKSVGYRADTLDDNMLRWQIAAMILMRGILNYENSLNRVPPKKYPRLESFLWGREEYQSPYPRGGGYGGWETAKLNVLPFYDFTENSYVTTDDCEVNWYFHNETRIDIAADIARGKTADFSENDMSEVAEFIRRGYVKKTGDELSLTFPVYTKEQYKELLLMIDDTVTAVTEQTRKFDRTAADVLVRHTPVPLKKEAESMGWAKMWEIMGASLKAMLDKGILQPIPGITYPAIYAVLLLA